MGDTDAQFALYGRELWMSRTSSSGRSGMQPKSAICAETTLRIDCAAGEIIFGPMHFSAVDMGDVAPDSATLRTALCAPDMAEKSHRVLLNLALAVDWVGQNFPERAPNK